QTIEAAAYFVIVELLTNAARHGRVTSAEVTVELVGETLRLEVCDDGIGGATMVVGGGLSGLRDRVGALGGTLQVDGPAPATGTRVRAALPTTVRGGT
ncbi:MAG: ATP-binding protein, partial [Lapillicoccus sp.]